MSVPFAVPATTFVLKGLIEARLKTTYGSHTPPPVTIAPPPRPAATNAVNGTTPAEAAGLILYLYQAGPNTAYRNQFEPHVTSQGARRAPSPLVLDLHYMLAATGSGLEREVLLGTGMFALHNVGILSRPLIASVLHGVAASESGSFMDGLYAEPLDTAESQPEEISISQEPVDVDQATKLWSALQSPLRPSAFYRVQAVFLVPDEAYPDPNTVDRVNVTVMPDPVRADQRGEP